MLSSSLNRLVLAKAGAIAWFPSANAPSTFEALRKAWHECHAIPVSPDACDHSIYGDPRVNMAFRAWHDFIHVSHGLTFSPDDERAVAHIQRKACNIPRDAALLWADVAGQVEYFQTYQEFPRDQIAFVRDYLASGMVRARF